VCEILLTRMIRNTIYIIKWRLLCILDFILLRFLYLIYGKNLDFNWSTTSLYSISHTRDCHVYQWVGSYAKVVYKND